jgi:hypothetical protein
MWGRYPFVHYESASDPDVRFRARIDHTAWSIMFAITYDDLEGAEGKARDIVAAIHEELSRRASLARVVVDLADYRRRQGGA